jgi:hypothetical protein
VLLLGSLLPFTASASLVNVTSGQTSVLLDTDTLSSVGLDLSGVSPAVIVPGNLGEGSVAFNINPQDAAAPLLPTTFSYTPGTLAPFSGTIEHEGSVFFNDNTVEVGNFTIGFDATRDFSGFFVASTVGVEAILFDIDVSSAVPTDSDLTVAGDLLVSPEFAGFLGNLALAGADVGDALVEAQVPVPATLALFALGLAGLGFRGLKQRNAA